MAPLNKETLVIVLQLVGVGWYVVVCIIGGLLVGLWLDKALQALPVFTLTGVILGTVMAFYGIYKMVLPLLNNNQGTEKRNGE